MGLSQETVKLARSIGAAAILAALALPSPVLAEVTTPGHLYGFGDNEGGQLGSTANIGTMAANPTPAIAALPEGSGHATEVAEGSFWTLVVTSSGRLYSFGSNFFGQLGTTTGSGTFTPEPTPELVTLPGASGPVVEAAGSEGSSVVLTSTGQLYGFGGDGSGELAQTPPSNVLEASPTPAPITVPGVTFTHVAAGGEHILAISSTGVIYTFGEDRYGQLGYETAKNMETNQNIPNPTPTPVTLPGESGTVTQVAGGLVFSLALTSTGQLYSFGENAYGQLGRTPPGEDDFHANPTPTEVSLPGATGAINHIAAGQFDSLVSTATGQLYAFGVNQCGQLGLETNSGTEKPNPTPTLVTLPGASGGIRELSSGAFQSLVLTGSGQLYAFGCNGYGQLGSTINNGKILTPNPTPTLVVPPEDDAIESISRGGMTLSSFMIVSGPAVREAEREKAAREKGSLEVAEREKLEREKLEREKAEQEKAAQKLKEALGNEILPPAAPGPVLGTAPVAPLPLTITHASVSSTPFRVGKGATAISASAPVGTTFRLTLSAAAKVQIALTSSAPGLRHGSVCVAPSARLIKTHAKHCMRTLTVGTLTRAHEAAGADEIAFTGRIGRRALKAGAYHAVLSASNAQSTAKPVTLSFAIAQ
jgi:alpha-tubulin suppressor-like RCC1 family protein